MIQGRGGGQDCVEASGYMLCRQYPIAGFIVDFACVEAGLVIELDGGQHLGHEAYDGYDAGRTCKLAVNGYKVLRFWNDDVLLRVEAVMEQICREIPPHPDPPLRTGEGARSERT